MKLFIAVTLEVFLIAFNVISQTQTFMLGMAGNYPEGYSYSGSSGVNWSLYNELSLNMWQGFNIGDRQAEVLDHLSAVQPLIFASVKYPLDGTYPYTKLPVCISIGLRLMT